MLISKVYITLIVIIIVLILIYPNSVLTVKNNGKYIFIFPYDENIDFTIKYNHSVQKLPTYENFRAYSTKKGIVLLSTEYMTFGAGLPSEVSDNFRHEKGIFIIDNINKEIKEFYWRVSDIAKHVLIINGKKIPLYKVVGNGEAVKFENRKMCRLAIYIRLINNWIN